jgi:hypothetical protein
VNRADFKSVGGRQASSVGSTPASSANATFGDIRRDAKKLDVYSEIYFYHNPGRFHPFYDRLLNRSALKNRVKRITHLSEIA